MEDPQEIDGEQLIASAVQYLIEGSDMDAAEADVRAQVGHPTGVRRYAEPARILATRRLTAERESLCIGIVYQANANPAASCSLQLHRADRLDWRRD